MKKKDQEKNIVKENNMINDLEKRIFEYQSLVNELINDKSESAFVTISDESESESEIEYIEFDNYDKKRKVSDYILFLLMISLNIIKIF